MAFSTLFIRVVIVYIELGIAVAQNQFASPKVPINKENNLRPRSITSESIYSRRKSCGNSINSGHSDTGSVTPKILDLPSYGIFPGATDRDFEGVGGWRFPGPDDAEDVLWTSMNSRLELPATVGERQRKHQRSHTSGSLATAPLESRFRRGIPSPETLNRSPVLSRARTPGTASPEESYVNRLSSKSTTALPEANSGRAMAHRHSSSSSTLSSASSAKTLQLKIPSG
ncbi:hypothetical protein MMC06_000903 [Schaereria dolodes]|nr:hypothetical protein [Schaereria dolodes]